MQTNPCTSKKRGNNRNPNPFMRLVYNWAAANMFMFRKWDACFYTFLYIVVPVSITVFSMMSPFNNLLDAAYCYFSLVINALNCIYDTAGRWGESVNIKKVKFSIIYASCFFALIYGVVQMIAILVLQTQSLRCDGLLCLYLPAVVVAAVDVFCVVSEEVSLGQSIF